MDSGSSGSSPRDLYVDQDGEALPRHRRQVHGWCATRACWAASPGAPRSLELPALGCAGRRRLDDAPPTGPTCGCWPRCCATSREASFAGRLMQLQGRCSSRSTATPTTRCCCWCTLTAPDTDQRQPITLLVASSPNWPRAMCRASRRRIAVVRAARHEHEHPAVAALLGTSSPSKQPLIAAATRGRCAPGARAVAALCATGVDDALWLEAVLHHHDDAPGGPLAGMEPAHLTPA